MKSGVKPTATEYPRNQLHFEGATLLTAAVVPALTLTKGTLYILHRIFARGSLSDVRHFASAFRSLANL